MADCTMVIFDARPTGAWAPPIDDPEQRQVSSSAYLIVAWRPQLVCFDCWRCSRPASEMLLLRKVFFFFPFCENDIKPPDCVLWQET
jgi:hypothetical protein